MFPLIPLPTHGWSKKDKAKDDPMDDSIDIDPNSEQAMKMWRKELRERPEGNYSVVEEIKSALGHHEPLRTEVPGVVCRAIEDDRAMFALSMWTNHWTFRLIAAYEQLKRGLPFMDCYDITQYCKRYLSKGYEDRERLERLSVLPLFFAPMTPSTNTEREVALSDILRDRNKEFDTLGCAFLKTSDSGECDLASGLLCTVSKLAETDEKAPDGGPWKTLPTFEQGKAHVQAAALEAARAAAQTSSTMDAAAVVRKEHEGNLYIKQTLEYLEQGNDEGDLNQSETHKKRASMLVAATQEVAQTLEKLWVEVDVAAGPLFRGDATPEDWVDTGVWARWPIATSFMPATANKFIGDTAARTPGTRLAILLAPGVRCIDIDRRMELDESNGGGRWLSCNSDEGELLVHPETWFYHPQKADGTFCHVVDVRGGDKDWKTGIMRMFHDKGLEPPDLSTFETALRRQSGVRPTTFENFRITVGFGNRITVGSGNSRKKPRARESDGKRKAARTGWTNFSDLERYL